MPETAIGLVRETMDFISGLEGPIPGATEAECGNYREQAYYDAHPSFLLLTPERRYVVEWFSGYVADTEESAWTLDFSGEESYLAWLGEVRGKSDFSCGVSPTAEDRVVTLSTCSYEFENARFVLHGILREIR